MPSRVHGRHAVDPRLGLFELRRDADQQVFTAVRGDEVHADRQALSAFQCNGNEIAGSPVMFVIGVYGTNVAARMKPRNGSSGVWNVAERARAVRRVSA